MSFKVVSIAAIVLFWGVAVGLFFAPASMLEAWNIVAHQEATFMGRRFAAVFFGLGILCLLARDLAPSAERQIIAFGLVSVLASLALLSTIEFLRGMAGPGILPAAAVEMAFAAAFFVVGRAAN